MAHDTRVALRALLDASFRSCRLEACRLRSSSDRRVVFSAELARDRPPERSAVIVKCARDASAQAIARINREAAAIRYLRGLDDPSLSHAAPELYCHDSAAGVIVMEDLVASRGARCLHDLLCAPDEAEAAACLKLLVRTLGRLHGLTLTRGADDGDQGRRGALRGGSGADALERDLGVFRRKLKAFGLRLDPQSAAELREIDRQLRASRLTSFCLRDVNPRNVFVSSAGVHFCDFEFAGFQHPILEGVEVGWLFPLSVESGSIPPDLTRQLKTIYRQQFDLSAICDVRASEAAAAIDFLFQYWVSTRPEAGLPVAFAGARSKVLELTRHVESTLCASLFPAISALLIRLGRALSEEGSLAPDTPLPYDCFGGSTRPAPTRHGDEHGSTPPADVSGMFRVNRHCHLVIKRHDRTHIRISVLQSPGIGCEAYWAGRGTFRAAAMPLALHCDDDGTVSVEDTRTGRIVELTRQRLTRVLTAHFTSVLNFWRHRLFRPPDIATALN